MIVYVLQYTHAESVKDFVALLLVLLENPQVFKDLGIDMDFIIESYAVLTEKVEDYSVRGLHGNVLELQGTTTDGISLVFSFFITSAKGKFVD